MEQVFNHMGHDPKVHKLWYRQTSGTMEWLHVGKLLMIHERNLVEKFKDKDLNEVTFEGNPVARYFTME